MMGFGMEEPPVDRIFAGIVLTLCFLFVLTIFLALYDNGKILTRLFQ
jgi:hypothetical protein